jgi:DNA-binding MarR family transcriptional regulator
MNEKRAKLIKLSNRLYRHTQIYLDAALEKFNLTSGMYPFILELEHCEGISQNYISKLLNVDKAMSARTIKRLIELKYIRKEIDKDDSRAYKLYLTEKSKSIIPEIKREIWGWIDIISNGLPDEEIDKAVDFLNNALINAQTYKDGNMEGEKIRGKYE